MLVAPSFDIDTSSIANRGEHCWFVYCGLWSLSPIVPLKMDVWGFAYAATVTVGGIVGYAKAGSTISLVMGLLFGSLSAVGSYQISRHPKDYWLLLCTSGCLAMVMGYRSFNSGKFMPAGLVATISALTVMRLGPRLLQ